MKTEMTYPLCDVMDLGIAALHEDGNIIWCWDGVAGMRRDTGTSVTTLITNVSRLPKRGWRPMATVQELQDPPGHA